MKLVIATHNKDKVAEISRILEKLDVQLLTMERFPKMPEPIEDCSTCAGNALKKARETAQWTKLPAIADDTGLCVEALDGAPGIYAARYAGPEATYRDNYEKLLRDLDKIPESKRTAYFICVAALVLPDGKEITCEGRLYGRIAFEPKGTGGFGYDPVFLLPDGRSLAEISAGEKNSISHRAIAFELMREFIQKLLNSDC